MEGEIQNNPPIAPGVPPQPQPPQEVFPTPDSKKPKWLWMLIGILVLLGLVWIIFYFFSKNRAPEPAISPSPLTNSNSSKGCGEQLNQAALNLFTSAAGVNNENIKWVVTNDYPKEFPVDFPKYANAKVLVYTSVEDDTRPNKVFITQVCSTDDIVKVEGYFKTITLAATGWQSQSEALVAQSDPNTPPALIEQIKQQLEAQPLKVFIKGGVSDTNKDPRNLVTVMSVQEGSGTRILYMSSY